MVNNRLLIGCRISWGVKVDGCFRAFSPSDGGNFESNTFAIFCENSALCENFRNHHAVEHSFFIAVMASPISTPKSVKEVTPEWLTSLLHHKGVISPSTKITTIEKTTLEGGFNATVMRLKVEYVQEEGASGQSGSSSPPSSYVLKFASVRVGDSSSEKELYLFQNLEKIPFPESYRPPKVYFAGKVGKSYVFILEDCGYAKHIPQSQGADYETARTIVVSLAHFHGRFWNSAPDAQQQLKEKYCPLADPEGFWEKMQGWMEGALDDFNTLVHDEETQKAAAFCARNLAKLVRRALRPPCTLLHGDARLSNYFVADNDHVIAVDWQGFQVGSGPGELAYFLSMNVQEDIRKKHENEFLHLYHDTLVADAKLSPSEFSFEDCYNKYIIGVATSGSVPVLTARGVLEGRKFIEKPPSNPGMLPVAQIQMNLFHRIQHHLPTRMKSK